MLASQKDSAPWILLISLYWWIRLRVLPAFGTKVAIVAVNCPVIRRRKCMNVSVD